MDRDSVRHPQDLLNSLLVRVDSDEDDDIDDDDYDRSNRLVTAAAIFRRNKQDTLRTHDGHAESGVANSRDPLHNLSSLNAYAEDPPPAQAQNAQLHTPSHLSLARMHQTAGDASRTQPQVTTLSLEEFDRLYDVQQARVASAISVPVPIALPITPPKSDAVPRFNHLCQTRTISHLFTFQEISKGLFSSKVEFGGHVCEAEGPFSSKKLAKEALAQQANLILESLPPSPLEEEQAKSKMKAKGKRKSSDQDDSENWLSLLHDFAQKQHHTQPVFRFFEAKMRAEQRKGLSVTPSQYSCVLNLQARPLYDFGSEEEFFQTKVEAKRVAARSAVTWLRTMGLLQESKVDNATHRKSSDDSLAGLAQEVSTMPTEKSAAMVVVGHSLRLGLSQPQFDLRPAGDQTGPNFYVCTAHYSDRDSRRVPQLGGPLCPTSPVYGQKNAKKMCCEALVILLERVVSERMDVEN